MAWRMRKPIAGAFVGVPSFILAKWVSEELPGKEDGVCRRLSTLPRPRFRSGGKGTGMEVDEVVCLSGELALVKRENVFHDVLFKT
jgi:hypothetical protein